MIKRFLIASIAVLTMGTAVAAEAFGGDGRDRREAREDRRDYRHDRGHYRPDRRHRYSDDRGHRGRHHGYGNYGRYDCHHPRYQGTWDYR